MKKNITIITLMFVLLTTLVAANVDVTYTFQDESGSPVNNIHLFGYQCLDSGCNSVGSLVFNETSNTNVITANYPTPSPTYGYAVYALKDGYRPMEGNIQAWGTASESKTVTMLKKDNCHSTIDEFSVINDAVAYIPLVINVSSSLDATTWSAFVGIDNGVGYVPPEYKDTIYSADTTVTLYIYDENGTLVHTDSQDLDLFMSTSERTYFNWTPTKDGDYTAKIETDVTDSICRSSEKQWSQKDFHVLPQPPTNQCYTLLNNLSTSHPYPVENQTYQIRLVKISNEADGTGTLTPKPTNLTLNVINENGTIVQTSTTTASANSNYMDWKDLSWDWTPTVRGWYNISVEGISSDCSYNENLAETVYERIYVDSAPNTNPILRGVPDQSVDEDTIPTFAIDLWNYATDEKADSDLTYSIIGESNQSLIDCYIDSNRYLKCNKPAENQFGNSEITIQVSDGELLGIDEMTVTVNPVNDAPVISDIPDITFAEDTTYSINLDQYVSDVDNTDAEMTWTVTGNTNIAVSIDANNIATLTPAADWNGEETLTFTVKDPSNAQDTDNAKITVTPDQVLSVSSITCFDYVVVDGNQSCSVFIEDQYGAKVGNAAVTIYYDDDSTFGTCTTDSISGGCEVKKLMTQNGTFSVYAQATKSDADPDNDKFPKFNFTVLSHRYDVEDLKIYNDASFTNEDYDFFRGEDMYVKFKVTDRNNNNQEVPMIVTSASLVSPPGGRINLTAMTPSNNYYYYKLTPIPITHEFLGNSQVFTFAYNFSDMSGGQKQIDVMIRNNIPIITNINDISLNVGETATINLAGSDVEDTTLTWSVSGINTNLYSYTLTNNVLTITSLAAGTDTFTVTLTDLDLDSSSQNVNINSISENPVAEAGGPYNGTVNQPITFDGSASTDNNGIVRYVWSFGDGRLEEGMIINHTYAQVGTYTATLTVYDADNNSASDNTAVTVNPIEYNRTEKATSPKYTLKFNKIRILGTGQVTPGDSLTVTTWMENIGDLDLKKLKLSAVIYETGTFRRVGPFDLDKGDSITKSVTLPIPKDVKPGDYTLRVQAANGNGNVQRIEVRNFKIA